MTEERECTAPGSEPGAGEWCREYCPDYGTGKCRYDPKTRKMMVKVGA